MSGFNGYIQLVYVLVAAMFVVGLHLMNSPATARRGNQVAQAGMVIAVVATLILLIHAGTVTATGWVVIVVGSLLGSAVDALPHADSRPPSTMDQIKAGWVKILADVRG